MVLGGIVLTVLFQVGPLPGEIYIVDTGIVQQATLATLLIASLSAAFLVWRYAGNRLNLALLAWGLAIYAAREHDLHRPDFLADHFTKWQFYAMPAVPLWQKLCFGALMVLIIATTGLFAIRVFSQGTRVFRQPWAKFAVTWAVVLLISQIIDRSRLNDTYSGRAVEETAELMAAGFALLVVWHFPRNSVGADRRAQTLPLEPPHQAQAHGFEKKAG